MLEQLEGHGVPGERPQAQLLDVQDDLGHVLLDVLDRAELVEDAGDLHGGDRGPIKRVQENPAQGIAEGDAVPVGERVDLEDGQVAARLDLFDPRGGGGL